MPSGNGLAAMLFLRLAGDHCRRDEYRAAGEATLASVLAVDAAGAYRHVPVAPGGGVDEMTIQQGDEAQAGPRCGLRPRLRAIRRQANTSLPQLP